MVGADRGLHRWARFNDACGASEHVSLVSLHVELQEGGWLLVGEVVIEGDGVGFRSTPDHRRNDGDLVLPGGERCFERGDPAWIRLEQVCVPDSIDHLEGEVRLGAADVCDDVLFVDVELVRQVAVRGLHVLLREETDVVAGDAFRLPLRTPVEPVALVHHEVEIAIGVELDGWSVAAGDLTKSVGENVDWR